MLDFAALLASKGVAGFMRAREGASKGVAGFIWARKSSPCALKTPEIWCFCACWANFFAEVPVEGRCWASFFAPTGLRRSWKQRGTLQTGGGGGFAALEAGGRCISGVSQL